MKKRLVIIIAILVVAAVIAIVLHFRSPFHPSSPPTPIEVSKPEPSASTLADERSAKLVLNTLAYAQFSYSVQHGGGGDGKFTGLFENLKDAATLSTNVEAALSVPGTQPIPLDGYVYTLHENPKGDGFTNNFLIRAMPGPGYTGTIWCIDKSKNIQQENKP